MIPRVVQRLIIALRRQDVDVREIVTELAQGSGARCKGTAAREFLVFRRTRLAGVDRFGGLDRRHPVR